MSYSKKIQSLIEDQAKGKDRKIKIKNKKGKEVFVSKIDQEPDRIADKIAGGVINKNG